MLELIRGTHMPQKLDWTASRDAQLRRMRFDGQSWDDIASELRISRWSTIERGKTLRAGKPEPGRRQEAADLGRDPLPAGHRTSWEILVAGSLLEGANYAGEPCFIQSAIGESAEWRAI